MIGEENSSSHVQRLWECDEHGHITTIYPIVGTVAGICANEIVGKNIFHDFSPCAVEDIRNCFDTVKTSQVPLQFSPDISGDRNDHFPSGLMIPKQDNGRFSGIVFMIDRPEIDRSDRDEVFDVVHDQMYDVLKASEDRFSFMVENLFLGFIVTRINGEITYLNDYMWQMHGFDSADEFKSISALDLWLDKSQRDRFAELIMHKGSLSHFEARMYKKNGDIINVLFNGYLYEDTLYCVAMDISERKKEEEILRKSKEEAETANQFKSRFLSMMSHDIRTPLNSVMGASDILKDANLTKEERLCVDLLGSAGENLMNIVNDILDLATIESGKIVTKAKRIEIRKFVDQTISLFYYSSIEKGIDLSVCIDDSVPEFLVVDDHYLSRILCNLLSNAIKFTLKGRVSLKVEMADSNILFAVSDTGVGIASDKLNVIFDEFMRTDNSTTRRFEGTGLGLAICKRLTHILGGEIKVDSKQNCGSTFRLTIPNDCGVEAGGENVVDFSEENVFSFVKRVLIADDSEANRSIIRLLLREHELITTYVENGIEALKFSTEHHDEIDLILTDLQMPLMDGYTFVSELRSWEKDHSRAALPVIALSASIMKHEVDKSIEAGCDGHISKPLRKKTFIEQINKHLLARRLD